MTRGRRAYRTLTLSARVAPTTRELVDQASAQATLDGVTDQTLRNFARKGMPVAQPGRRPRYCTSDIVLWHLYYEHLKRAGGGTVEGLVSFDKALDWHLARQFRTGEEPSGFALVPLAWNHPLRARQLELAAAGREPTTPNEEDCDD